MRLFQLILILCLATVQGWAHNSYTGYSGAPGRGTCASQCHGSGTGSITVTGFPASYTPGQPYTLTIGHSSGSTISNFNGSCRVGTGSTNAGTLAAGTGTITYNTTGETNGVKFSSNNQNSGTFTWTAPATGTGTSRLYVAGIQGGYSGVNTALVLVSNEAAGVPGVASNPNPANNANGVLPTAVLTWTAGSGATSHDVFFGTSNPPDSVTNQTGSTFTPADTLTPGAVFYWRINERNTLGVTPGPVWQFTVLSAPGEASNPSPTDQYDGVCIFDTLRWTAGTVATSHDVYFGTTNPPPFIVRSLATSYHPAASMTPATVYYWQINARNAAGLTPGTVWSFTTQSLPSMATIPSPADGDSNITVRVTLSWQSGTSVETHSVYLGTTNPPPLVIQDLDGSNYTPLQNLVEGTTYYWRVDEVSCSGTATGSVWSFRTENPDGIRSRISPVPTELALGPVYPNPFNTTVSIPFALPHAARVRVALYDITGRQVALMADGTFSAGTHSVQWSSEGVGSGIYFVRLTANGRMLNAKVVAIK